MDNKNEKTIFRAFSRRYDGIPNTLTTDVSFSSSFKDLDSKVMKCIGIWDTGATTSAISSEVAKNCGLIPIGKTEVHTANGVVAQNVYLVDILLPNHVIVGKVKVTEVSKIHGADALIGMDVMSFGDMAISHGNGRTIFTFKVPSSKAIDFVEEIDRENEKEIAKAKREQERILKQIGNQKCPCGSGKKYRYCCGKKAREAELVSQS